MTVTDTWVDIGLNLHVRYWTGEKTPFVLVHGLASNARTWDAVAAHLHAAGHPVYAVDQRGHGRSDKPDSDFTYETVTADLKALFDTLAIPPPILVGQSWGGNVVLALGALHPGVVQGVACIDGGYIDLQARPNHNWDQTAAQLKPPALVGTPVAELRRRIAAVHPDWTAAGVEATLHNFEHLPDQTIRPWLSLEHHMRILWSMWSQRPIDFYPQVQVPVLFCVADDGHDVERRAMKTQQVEEACRLLPRAEAVWFEHTDHDIHVHRPEALAHLLLQRFDGGFWPAL